MFEVTEKKPSFCNVFFAKLNIALVFFFIFLTFFIPKIARGSNDPNLVAGLTSASKDVCRQLNLSLKIQKEGDFNKAYNTALEAYYKVYDLKIEPQVRAHLGGRYVFKVERAFSHFSQLILHPSSGGHSISSQEFQKKINALCDEVQKNVDDIAQALSAQKTSTTKPAAVIGSTAPMIRVNSAPTNIQDVSPPAHNLKNILKRYGVVLETMREKLTLLTRSYKPSQSPLFVEGVNNFYTTLYEGSGLENFFAVKQPSLNQKIETLTRKLILQAISKKSHDEIQVTSQALENSLVAGKTLLLLQNKAGFSSLFFESFLILLREGFEALLVVVALLAYLDKVGQKKRSGVIYVGVGLAVLASALTAWSLETFLASFKSHQGILEGGTMLLAAFFLIYLSYWFFSKRDTQNWKTYLERKVQVSSSSNRLFALGATAFLAVYREGAETILFMQAALAGDSKHFWPISLGFSFAALGIFFLFYVLKKLTIRLPYRLFFSLTSLFLFFLAFRFVGYGIVELQGASIIPFTPTFFSWSSSFFGIYPTWEGVLTQVILFLPMLLGYIIWRMKNKEIKQ